MRRISLAALFAALLLTGCGPTGDIYLKKPTHSSIELNAVPFYPQQEYLCGPASLRMVAEYWKQQKKVVRDVSYETIRQVTFIPEKKGSFRPQMVAAARQLGLVAIESTRRADLFELLDGGIPVIVLLNQGTVSIPVWHYAVVIGFDLDRQLVILRSGDTKRQAMKISTFYEFFKKGGHWKLIAVPATMVPPGVTEASYLKAAYDLEQTLDDEIVQIAYESALKQWPDSLLVKLAAANYFFDKYHYEIAYDLYDAVLKKEPDDPIALNNMAETLYYLGEFDEALDFIDRAIKNHGKYKKEFDDTRRKILHSIESGEIILPNGL